MIAFPPCTILQIWIVEKMGIRFTVLLGIFIQAIAMIIRSFIQTSFWYVIIGQVMLAMAQPLLNNLPSKISAVWFPAEERMMSTMIGVNAILFGVVIGFLAPGLIVT